MKQYVALARVSSREQQREGFSLDIQVDALTRYAESHQGEIIKLFRIAETASKKDERKTFKEMIAYTKKYCDKIDALLFYKVDRAARNLVDYVELEKLESDYDVPFISVSQPTDSNPAGRMMRRTLANMASFYTEQMAVELSQGIQKRGQEGWFPGKSPYGYENVRMDGRSIVRTVKAEAEKVRRVFKMYAYGSHTLESIVKRLDDEGITFRPSTPKWRRTTVHNIFTHRGYIGEVLFRGNWYAGKHEAIVDRSTFDRVQSLLRPGQQHTHTTTYSSDLISCGHCGYKITGELKVKKTLSGLREYIYYRCTKYNKVGHPRTRVEEADLDRQVLDLFSKLNVETDDVRNWIRSVLAAKTKEEQDDSKSQRAELQRQESLLTGQQDRLLNLRIDDQIDEVTFVKKQTEFRNRSASIRLQLDALNRDRDETASIALKAFELSQTLANKWLTAEYAVKRQMLEIIGLNWELNDVTLYATMRKPFDQLAKGLLLQKSGAGGN